MNIFLDGGSLQAAVAGRNYLLRQLIHPNGIRRVHEHKNGNDILASSTVFGIKLRMQLIDAWTLCACGGNNTLFREPGLKVST